MANRVLQTGAEEAAGAAHPFHVFSCDERQMPLPLDLRHVMASACIQHSITAESIPHTAGNSLHKAAYDRQE